MLISAVMANYNGGRYIRDAIESVLAQDIDSYEFIIVDDGSTDSSREIIESFRNQHPEKIKALYRDNNTGQGACLNAGIHASNGDIVCLLDSDDFWLPSKLGNVCKCFSSRDGVAFHQHNLLMMRKGKVTQERFRLVLTTGNYFSYIKTTKRFPVFAPTSALSFRRHILEKVLPIPEEFRVCADGYLTRTCFCYGDVAADSECWGVYRVHNENATFENAHFNDTEYIAHILLPALNNYYRTRGIDFTIGEPPEKRLVRGVWRWIDCALNFSPKFLLGKLLPKQLYWYLGGLYGRWSGISEPQDRRHTKDWQRVAEDKPT